MESGVLLLLAFRRQLSIGFTAPLGDPSDQLLGQLGIIWETDGSLADVAVLQFGCKMGDRFLAGIQVCVRLFRLSDGFVGTGGYRKGAAADFYASAAAPFFFFQFMLSVLTDRSELFL